MGAITPIGLTAHEFWENLLAGVSGVGPITRFDTTDFPVKIAAEVNDFEVGKYMDTKDARRMSRSSQLAVAAARLAADDAGLELTDEERPRAASAIATGSGGAMETMEEMRTLIERGPGRVSPFYIPIMAPNMGSCQVAMTLGLRGPAMASVAACASGLYSFFEAKYLIDSGLADVVVAGGTEAAIHPLPIAGLANMKALSRRNDEPKRASRPFDLDREGFVFGEGAAVMIIESEERATKRGARVYAELAGAGLSSDAFHITAPLEDGSGAAPGDGVGSSRGRDATGRRGLRRRSRNGDAAQRRLRNGRHQGCLRGPREQAGHQLAEIDGGPPARRGRGSRRAGSGLRRVQRPRSAHGEPRNARPPVRPRLRAAEGPRYDGSRSNSERIRLWRPKWLRHLP